jgi:predicted nucleic acid-binding protein
MPLPPLRILLDTNVFILGVIEPDSFEGQILAWLEQIEPTSPAIEILISEPLLDQITRVAKRLVHKDWAGHLLNRVLSYPSIRYTLIDDNEVAYWLTQKTIPHEDIEIYLTAKAGVAQCFVSTNHELIQALVKQTQDCECLTPEAFFNKYLSSK